jgi:hypothetical protein
LYYYHSSYFNRDDSEIELDEDEAELDSYKGEDKESDED